MNTPANLKYTKTHEWLSINGNKAKMGITDYAQSELGDIVYVEFPEIGDEFGLGDEAMMVDSAKTTAQIYVQVACKVTGLNDKLNEKPELVNTDPYGEGYMIEIELTNPTEVEDLMDATAYADYVESGGDH